MTSDTSPRPVSPLRARMIEDMTVRSFNEHTRRDYVRHVRAFAAFIGRSPDTATAEDLRLFQLHQTRIGMQPPSINSSVSALRFFFTVTLDRPDLSRRLTVVPQPRRIPAVLSVEEVRLLLRAASAPKYKAAFAAGRLAVSRPQPGRAAVGPPALPRRPCRRPSRGYQEARVATHAAAQFRHAPPGAGCRYSRDPDTSGPCQTRHHSALHPRRQYHDPGGNQPPRPSRTIDRRETATRHVARRPCAARGWRSQTSFIAMEPTGAEPMPGM